MIANLFAYGNAFLSCFPPPSKSCFIKAIGVHQIPKGPDVLRDAKLALFFQADKSAARLFAVHSFVFSWIDVILPK